MVNPGKGREAVIVDLTRTPIDRVALLPVMNDTKWDELRLAMYDCPHAVYFRRLSDDGDYARPDGEWFYHFRVGGYADIIHVDIEVDAAGRQDVLDRLRRVHVPGHATEHGFRVFGYVAPGTPLGYL